MAGRVKLLQPRQGFRAAIDPVLLAAFIPARSGQRVLEGGCGSGAAFLCLAARIPGVRIVAIERDGELATLACRNAKMNQVEATVHATDLRLAPDLGTIDHAFANPPYWPAGTPSPNPARRQAAHMETPLGEWVRVLSGPLRHRGTLSLVLPASRWSEAATAMRGAGLGAVRLIPVHPRAGTAAKRVLLQGRLGARGADEVLAGLCMHSEGGSFTADAEAILRDCGSLPPSG